MIERHASFCRQLFFMLWKALVFDLTKIETIFKKILASILRIEVTKERTGSSIGITG